MTRCPKCGSGRIIGPRYVRTIGWFTEALRYTCAVCGYMRDERTKDDHKGKR